MSDTTNAGITTRVLYSAALSVLLATLAGCYEHEQAPPPSRPTAALEAFRDAEASLRKGKLKEALNHAGDAVKSDPTFHEAAWLQASLLGRAGRLEEALAVAQDLTARAPDFVQAHLLQGILWDQSGDLEAAHRSYDIVLELYGPDPAGLRQRDAMLRALVTFLRYGELEGVKSVNQFLERFPEHPTALYLKGCMQNKDRGFLLRWFSESNGGQPVNPEEPQKSRRDTPGAEAPASDPRGARTAEKE